MLRYWPIGLTLATRPAPPFRNRLRQLPTEVWVIALAPNHSSETIIPALVCGVMARVAKYDAIVHGVRSSQLDVFNVMGVRALAVSVFRSPCLAKSRDARPTARTPMVLASKRHSLRRPRELVGSWHHYFSSMIWRTPAACRSNPSRRPYCHFLNGRITLPLSRRVLQRSAPAACYAPCWNRGPNGSARFALTEAPRT